MDRPLHNTDVTTWSASSVAGVTWSTTTPGPSSSLTPVVATGGGAVTLWVRAMHLAIFGPGWSSTLDSTQSDWAKLEDLGSAGVRLTDSCGGQWYVTKTGADGSGASAT